MANFKRDQEVQTRTRRLQHGFVYRELDTEATLRTYPRSIDVIERAIKTVVESDRFDHVGVIHCCQDSTSRLNGSPNEEGC